MLTSLSALLLTIELLKAQKALAQVELRPYTPPVAPKTAPRTIESPKDEAKRINAHFAKKYGNDVGVTEEVLRCESNFNQNAKGDVRDGKYMANGISQFWYDTFLRFKKESGLEVDYDSMEGQIELFQWAVANDYDSHWVCYGKVLKGK